MNKLIEKMIDRMVKASSVPATLLSESDLFDDSDFFTTDLPILNVAFSGKITGGINPGITILAGESKTFKSALSLYCMKAYLNKYEDAIGILYDTEFGITPDYIKSFGIDPSRVLHIPVDHIEQLKFDFAKKLEELKKGDRVFFLVDSLGQISSKKEVDDAHDEKSVADMTRAKAIRSLLRLITNPLSKKKLPCFLVNHVYVEMGCLESNTKIQTMNGNIPIKDIKIGDKVYTNNGVEIVEYVYTPKEIPTKGKKYLKINFDDGTSVNCTDNHEFLDVNGNWIKAGDFTTETLLM